MFAYQASVVPTPRECAEKRLHLLSRKVRRRVANGPALSEAKSGRVGIRTQVSGSGGPKSIQASLRARGARGAVLPAMILSSEDPRVGGRAVDVDAPAHVVDAVVVPLEPVDPVRFLVDVEV